MEKKEFAQRLKSIRIGTGMSQEELAERIERSVDTVSSIERGKNFPNYLTATRLAEVFGVGVNELMGEEEKALSLERVQLLADINVKTQQASDQQLRLIRDLVSTALKNT